MGTKYWVFRKHKDFLNVVSFLLFLFLTFFCIFIFMLTLIHFFVLDLQFSKFTDFVSSNSMATVMTAPLCPTYRFLSIGIFFFSKFSRLLLFGKITYHHEIKHFLKCNELWRRIKTNPKLKDKSKVICAQKNNPSTHLQPSSSPVLLKK